MFIERSRTSRGARCSSSSSLFSVPSTSLPLTFPTRKKSPTETVIAADKSKVGSMLPREGSKSSKQLRMHRAGDSQYGCPTHCTHRTHRTYLTQPSCPGLGGHTGEEERTLEIYHVKLLYDHYIRTNPVGHREPTLP
jgi:hypothetical protein